jgi:hypothetical protein
LSALYLIYLLVCALYLVYRLESTIYMRGPGLASYLEVKVIVEARPTTILVSWAKVLNGLTRITLIAPCTALTNTHISDL